MGHIFINYSHKDKSYVHRLQDALQREGFEVWIDDRIDYGTRWPKVIQDQLDTCSAFIVIVSENSYESEWVQNEVTRAKRKQKPFFPLLLSGDPWLSVETTQYLTVTDQSLPPPKFYDNLTLVLPRKARSIPVVPTTVHPQQQPNLAPYPDNIGEDIDIKLIRTEIRQRTFRIRFPHETKILIFEWHFWSSDPTAVRFMFGLMKHKYIRAAIKK